MGEVFKERRQRMEGRGENNLEEIKNKNLRGKWASDSIGSPWKFESSWKVESS